VLKKLFYFFLFLLFSEIFAFSQLSYNKEIVRNQNVFTKSNIAYKLPYRGKNYKFYGSISFHIFGKAFVDNRVYNIFTEAGHCAQKNMPEIQINIKACSRKKHGILIRNNHRFCGNQIIFLYPLKKNEKPIKNYSYVKFLYHFYRFNKNGQLNKKIFIDFESTAQYLINLDDAAHFFGIRIKSISVNRAYIKELYKCSFGKELKKRHLRFVKYVSEKTNRKYRSVFLIEFE